MSVEEIVRSCSLKKSFLKISRNLQENTCVGTTFSIKLQAATLLKKEIDSDTGVSSVNFAKLLRIPILKSNCEWLLLEKLKSEKVTVVLFLLLPQPV